MPSDSPIRFESIPDALQSYDQWVCWETILRDGKPTKQPINPATGTAASATDPDTWGPLEDARSHLQAADVDGIGFVFTDEDPFVGIDLDKCCDPDDGSVAPWASRIITQLNSYTERSPSGTGFHILLEGSVPGDRKRRGDVEMYEAVRYFTVTGDHVTSTPQSIGRRPKSLADLHREFLESSDGESEDTQDNREGHPDTKTTTTSPPTESVELDDQQLLEKARSAANGDDFDALWQGSTASYDSHSEADMALACHLAFWTGGDPARIDALFRKSSLMRDKWDEQHYADGSTYGEKTIERARTKVTEYYDPDHTSAPTTPTIDELVAATEADQPTTQEQSPQTTPDNGAPTTAAVSMGTTSEGGQTATEPPDSETPTLGRRIATLQAAIDDLKQRFDDQQRQIDELETAVTTLQTRLATQSETADHDTEDPEASDPDQNPAETGK